MPDGLYDRDILEWSERQSALLRRVAAGEKLNEEVDWPNLIDEIESVGRSELDACENLLVQALRYLMQVRQEPGSLAVPCWRSKVVFHANSAGRRFSPSMRQSINVPSLYAEARGIVRAGAEGTADLPAMCPYTLDDLLADDLDLAELVARLG